MQTVNAGSLIVAGIACVGVLSGGLWIWLRRAPTEEERERQRRLGVFKGGRMTDAWITEAHESTLYYTYTAQGMTYMASQDISPVRHMFPEDLALLVGPVTVKYMRSNPANSIVACEEWVGIRNARPDAPEKQSTNSTSQAPGT